MLLIMRIQNRLNLTEWKGEIDNSTIIGDFDIPLSVVNRTSGLKAESL